jgi:hypothetical protein
VHVHELKVHQGPHASIIVPSFLLGLGNDSHLDSPIICVCVEHFDWSVEVGVMSLFLCIKVAIEVLALRKNSGVV